MGKRFLLILNLFLLVSLPQLFAEEEAPSKLKGLSLETRLSGAVYGENELSAAAWDMTFMPTMHFRTEGKLEIAPYLLVRYQNETDPDHYKGSNPEIYTDLNRLSLGIGAGLYWDFLKNPWFHVLSGFRPEFFVEFPQWGDSAPTGYYNFDPGIGALVGSVAIPLGFEFNTDGRLGFRFWMECLRFNARWDENYYRDDIIERTVTLFADSPFWGGETQSLSFSLLLRF
jgi:hypothetical protein